MKNAQSLTPPAAAAGETFEPYPGYHREVAALQAKVDLAQVVMNGNPVPGPLREAFAGELPVVHGFTLQPVIMALHPLLVQIDSPLLAIARIWREEFAPKNGEMPISDPVAAEADNEARCNHALARIASEIKAEDYLLMETAFVFVRPEPELRALLASGREKFREAAIASVGQLHQVKFDQLLQAVSKHYSASFATAVNYEPPAAGEGNFRMPPASATGSAGGSSCWARLCGIFTWLKLKL